MEKHESKEHKEHGKEAGSGDPAVDAMAAPHASGEPPTGAGMGAMDGSANPDHPDQNQDVELFKQLIAQYLGPDYQDSDEAMKMCQSAYHEAMAEGMSHDESMKCAGYGLKAAHLLTKKESREASMKQAVGGAEPIPPVATGDGAAANGMPGVSGLAQGSIESMHQGMPPPPASPGVGAQMHQGFPPAKGGAPMKGLPPSKSAQSHDASSDGKQPAQEGHKESNLIRLTAENARLREANARLQLDMHLNNILRESGMTVKTTKAFRNIVSGMKTIAQIDAAWREFKEAFSESRGTSSVPFVFGIEKQLAFEARAEGDVLSLSDCISKVRI